MFEHPALFCYHAGTDLTFMVSMEHGFKNIGHEEPVIQGMSYVIGGNPYRDFGPPGGGLFVYMIDKNYWIKTTLLLLGLFAYVGIGYWQFGADGLTPFLIGSVAGTGIATMVNMHDNLK